MIRRVLNLLTWGALVVALPLLITPAIAQNQADADAEMEEVIVTGSKIKRSSYDSLQASVVVGEAAIQDRASVNVAEILNSQPAFSIPGNSAMGSGGGNNNGQNHVNCLGLGANRTLTLVNSKRFISSNSAANVGTAGLQVDLNVIPTQLIDRVETITVGGAPVYGTDAIACTVNIILKEDYNDFEVNVVGGMSVDEGDAESYSVSLVKGFNFNGERGNLTLSVDHSYQDGLLWTDRPDTAGRSWSFLASTDPNSPYLNTLVEDATLGFISESGLPLLVGQQFFIAPFGNGIRVDPTDPTSPLAQFDDQGNLVPFVPGVPTGAFPVFWDGGDGIKMAEHRALLHDLERTNANIFFRYDLTENVKLKAEGWFADHKADLLATELHYQSVVFGGSSSLTNYGRGPVPVLLSNPFVTDSTRAIVTSALDPDGDGVLLANIDTDGDGIPDAPGLFVERNFPYIADGGPLSTEKKVYRAVVGLEGAFQLAEREYSWELAYIYGKSKNKVQYTQIIPSRFMQATNVVADPATGNPVCADPSGGCVPLNVMVSGDNVDPGAAAFVTGVNDPVSINEQGVFMASVTGPLFDLPAGPIEFALGYDHRIEKAKYSPGELDQQGLLLSSTNPIEGKYNTDEFYLEALVPLTSPEMDIPLLYRVELEGAARRVDNSIAGSDDTWTVGLRFSPVEDIEFRGNITRSIRAPATSELFLPETPAAAFGDDPCDARYINQGNFPERRSANCAADGITQPFTSIISDAFQQGPGFTAGGNPDLLNETAKSWSAGIILRPSFIEGLSVSFDWIEIDISDAIETLGVQTIMNACYDSAAFPNEPACGLFTRNAEGQISSFRAGFVNIGQIEFAGLLTNIDYVVDAGKYGFFNFGLNSMYSKDVIFTTAVDNPVDLAGQIGFSSHRILFRGAWEKNRWRWYNEINWISGANFDNTDTEFTRDVADVPDFWVLNSSLRFALRENLSLQLNVNNVFDKDAPDGVPQIYGALPGHVQTYASGIFGRNFSMSARFRF